MFYVICRDCVNMLKIGGYASCAREQAENMPGNYFLSIGGARGHAAVILGEVRMKVKMVQKCSLALNRFGVIAVDRIPCGAFSSHLEGV